MRGHKYRVAATFVALALAGAACGGRDDNNNSSSSNGGSDSGSGSASSIDTANCPTDPTTPIKGDTIDLASSYPQSGLTAAFSEIATGWKSYFNMLNDAGGVEFAGKKYKIAFKDKDDMYDPAQTSANVDELVGPEGDKAFATFSVVGTANNLAIRENLNDLCVPNVFAATGSPAWGDPNFPWTIGSTLGPYSLEGSAFTSLLKDQKPNAKVALLVQDDDFGKAYEEGFKNAIKGTDITVAKVEKYKAGADNVDAQITSLKASGADAFFNGATLLACPGALNAASQQGWKPLTWVSSTCTSKTLLGIAGAAANGVYSYTNLLDPLNPANDSEGAMKEYKDTVKKYFPDADTSNGIMAYGWTQAALFQKALEQAKEPTRLALMESLHDLSATDIGVLLPGITVKSGADDSYFGETYNLEKYKYVGSADTDVNRFDLVGDPIDFEGKTADVTPAELIDSSKK
jgi:branched-chain amino acid transport system substrate-binding protein